MSNDYLGDLEYSPDKRISYINIIENEYVIKKPYCCNCGSLDIKKSSKGNLYCSKICWKNKKIDLGYYKNM